jgi:glutathione synthase/RimK-type ligase-like ATP-grasp enzyme
VHLAWDDPAVDWTTFDAVVLRSTWDSVDRPAEFLAWAATVPTLLNPAPAVEATLDKRYLASLDASVPTQWVAPGERWDPPAGELVVKPTISAGGRETARYRPDEHDAARAHVGRLHAAGQTAMVQPFLPGVDGDGELKLVFLGGEFSHAVRVGPLLRAGTGVQERLWERPIRTVVDRPTAAEVAVAAEALDQLGGDFVYARVDLVDGYVGEVELIDPVLFLTLVPEAADRLAAAVVARI